MSEHRYDIIQTDVNKQTTNLVNTMKTQRVVGLIIIALAYVIFAVFVLWGIHYNHLQDGWAVGIWFAAAISFVTGVILFVETDTDNKKQEG